VEHHTELEAAWTLVDEDTVRYVLESQLLPHRLKLTFLINGSHRLLLDGRLSFHLSKGRLAKEGRWLSTFAILLTFSVLLAILDQSVQLLRLSFLVKHIITSE